ncbi:MAG: hypothetical protein EAZ16_13245 [Sphingobacteriales bacterium]|jgi:hypothetical protein|nr:MAG: hypothetical protein EAZ16_13245 [Sphingobacteriales bacterium]
MKKSVDEVMVEFNTSACYIYESMFQHFLHAINNISRTKEENVFKMQAAKYSSELNDQLRDLLQHLMNYNSIPKNHLQMQLQLQNGIQYYLHGFTLRVNAS